MLFRGFYIDGVIALSNIFSLIVFAIPFYGVLARVAGCASNRSIILIVGFKFLAINFIPISKR